MPLMGRARITGIGGWLPERVVDNQYFVDYLDTSDDWISSRTGISSRRFGGPTSALAVAAGRQALDRAGLRPDEIDLLVLATSTPDQVLPQTAAVVQHQLGLRCGAFDINVACTGFVYATAVAASLTRSHRRVLVVGSEQMSRIIDPNDRSTAILMADGAGAMVIERSDSDRDDVWADLGSDGSLREALYADHGGFMVMRGSEVFKNAVRFCSESVQRLIDEAGIAVDQVDLFVPHQANQRIIEAVIRRLGIPEDRCVSIVRDTGNTSAASIPLALTAALTSDRLGSEAVVVMAGFGAGMAWGSLLARVTPPGIAPGH
ncbi:MAG TPA: beta-ketoacyl-ACP synthase III [Acidimicrobiales bacterium]|nr:beta-ketoacyl-ACP synthase III [Acidimicrobiales bacterium]